MAKTKTKKPEYLDLLNTICLPEGRAGVYLKAWSEKTQHPALKQYLTLVSARETSNHLMFKRRIEELGFEVQMEVPSHFGERMTVATSDMADSEKINAMEEIDHRQPPSNLRERYTAAIEDEAVDPLTRSMLRYWRDVEADSGNLKREAFAKVQGAS